MLNEQPGSVKSFQTLNYEGSQSRITENITDSGEYCDNYAKNGCYVSAINSDLKEALKNKNTLKLSVLRMVKSKVLYVNARGDLPENEILKIINKYAKEIKETISETKKVGRLEEAKQAEIELKIVNEYLPKQLTDEEIKALIKQSIEETKAGGMKDMGKVMKAVLAKAPAIDGKVASQMVREALK